MRKSRSVPPSTVCSRLCEPGRAVCVLGERLVKFHERRKENEPSDAKGVGSADHPAGPGGLAGHWYHQVRR